MRFVVLGAGRMGQAIAFDLARTPEVGEVVLADRNLQLAKRAASLLKSPKVIPRRIDASASSDLVKFLRAADCVASALPYYLNLRAAKAAVSAKVNFCDLGGSNAVVKAQLALDPQAKKAGVTVIPDCGLAPGLAGLLAANGIEQLDAVESVNLRVGGLPQHPKPPLDYLLTWSVEGLINEYTEKCTVIRQGKVASVDALDELEELTFPPPFGRMEAFHTSGGASTLPQTFAGRVRNLDYKTIRYPGHCAKIKTLISLGLAESKPVPVDGQKVIPRAFLKTLLEKHLEREGPDVVLVRVEVAGTHKGQKRKITYQLIDYFDTQTGLSAMMRCTGFSIAVVALLLARGEITQKGALPQERAVPVDQYIAELRARGIGIKEEIL